MGRAARQNHGSGTPPPGRGVTLEAAQSAVIALEEAGYEEVRVVTFETGKEVVVASREGKPVVLDSFGQISGDIHGALVEAAEWFDEIDPEDFLQPPDWSQEFWQFPSDLFHGTDAGNIDDILVEGLQPLNHTRGITNEYSGHAVFTHSDPDYAHRYAAQHEEGVILTINIRAMKEDGYTPDAGPEEPVREALMRGEMAEEMGLKYYDAFEHLLADGVDSETVIIEGTIPPKYLTVTKVTEDEILWEV